VYALEKTGFVDALIDNVEIFLKCNEEASWLDAVDAGCDGTSSALEVTLPALPFLFLSISPSFQNF
jgi:hypothetical protein